jgi:hypothetical protein
MILPATLGKKKTNYQLTLFVATGALLSTLEEEHTLY